MQSITLKGDYVSLHNEYLDILVYHGDIRRRSIPGIYRQNNVVCRWLKTFRKHRSEEDRDYIGVLSACCIVQSPAAMLFLLEGLHTNSPGTHLFYGPFLGYLMHYSYKSRDQRKR